MTRPSELTLLNPRMLLEIEGKAKGVSSVEKTVTSQESVPTKMRTETKKSQREEEESATSAIKKVTWPEIVQGKQRKWSIKMISLKGK